MVVVLLLMLMVALVGPGAVLAAGDRHWGAQVGQVLVGGGRGLLARVRLLLLLMSGGGRRVARLRLLLAGAAAGQLLVAQVVALQLALLGRLGRLGQLLLQLNSLGQNQVLLAAGAADVVVVVVV